MPGIKFARTWRNSAENAHGDACSTRPWEKDTPADTSGGAMEITKELQELAKFSDRMLPVFSVYLNTQADAPEQRGRSAAFLAQHLQQAHTLPGASDAARTSLEHDLTRIQE